jgi:predicted phage terminase large subunit-like protein
VKSDKESLLNRIKIDREVIRRRGLVEFGRRAWHLVEPSVPYKHNWHVDQICNHLLAMTAGVAPMLVVNVPPGTGKSLWFSVFYPAWLWTVWPGATLIYASYDTGISCRDAERTLKIIQSDWYQERWPHVQLASRTPSKTDFSNTAGGFRFATSVEGAVTGRHADIRVVDDPIKPVDVTGGAAASGVQLQKVIDWHDGTLSTRVKDPNCPRLALIMQRLHLGDLAGYLLEKYKSQVTHLRLPMRYEPESPSWNEGIGGDMRTFPGELLWPGRYNEAAVRKLELELNIWAPAQLQQNPVTAEGEIFKGSWFKTYRKAELPPNLSYAMSVDCTFRATTGSDFVCVQIWGTNGVKFFLLEEVCERLSFTDTVAAIRAALVRWPRVGPKLIEAKANGDAVIELLSKTVIGIIPITPEGGKIARANAVSHLHQAGNVFYPDPSEQNWSQTHQVELLSFPKAKHDDRVDAETQYLAYASQNGASVWSAMNALIARGG